MFKMFNRKTSKADVIMAAAGALVAVWKAFDTAKQYKLDNENQENEK